jgi:hypothetical protein
MLRLISPRSGPEKTSRMAKDVAPPAAGVSVKVRTPRKRPRGMPPCHTMRSFGTSSLTVTGNARSGLTVATTLIFLPSAISPSTRTTVGFQSGYWAASVSRAQMALGEAWIVAAAWYSMARRV